MNKNKVSEEEAEEEFEQPRKSEPVEKKSMSEEEMLKCYPPPMDSKEYVKKWVMYLPMVVNRDNFHHSHLSQLEILCQLFDEYYTLTDIMKVSGYTYKGGSNDFPKSILNPEISQLNIVRRQIAEYMRLLGLMLVKDSAPVKGESKKKDSWD